jgi:hypothetical protein
MHYISNKNNQPITIKSLQEAYEVFNNIFDENASDIRKEFNIVDLNRASKVIGPYQDSKGAITGAAVDLRFIFSIILNE